MHGLNKRYETVIVTHRTSNTITGTIECGANRGKTGVFQISEIVHCQEVFGSSLQSFFQKVKTLDWTKANRSKTKELPHRQPKLNPQFIVSPAVLRKRKWHIMRILGKGVDLLVQRTNLRAKSRLARCSSEKYKVR